MSDAKNCALCKRRQDIVGLISRDMCHDCTKYAAGWLLESRATLRGVRTRLQLARKGLQSAGEWLEMADGDEACSAINEALTLSRPKARKR